MMDKSYDPMLDKLSHGMIITNPDGTILHANSTAHHLFGYHGNSISGMYIDDIFGQDIHYRMKSFGENPDLHNEITFNIMGIRADDALLACLVNLSAGKIHDNLYFVLEIIDLNTVYEIEQKVFEKNNLFLRLANNIPGVVYRMQIAPTVKFLYVSDGIQRITGHNPADFYRKNSVKWEEIVYDQDIKRIRKLKKDQLQRFSQFDINYRLIRKNGTICWVKDQGKGQYDKKGKLISIEGNLVDITSIKEKQNTHAAFIMDKEDAEKFKLAANINDGLHQSLAMAAVRLREVSEEIDRLSGKTRKTYFKGIELLEKAITESRQISYELMPRTIRDFGLAAAIEDLAMNWEKRHNASIKFTHNLTNDILSDFEKNSFYIIIKELMATFTRNQITKKIKIDLCHNDNELHVSISGHQPGLNRQIIKREDSTLIMVKHRIRALQGKFSAYVKENDYIQYDVHAPLNVTLLKKK